MIQFRQLSALLLGLILTGLSFAQEYYRFRDENGVMRMEPTIPAEYVDKGYDVLNSQGVLVRRVPAKKVVEEVDPVRQAEDQILLSSYSSVEEIEAHRDRRLAGIQRQEDITRSDRKVLTGELDKEIKAASGYRVDGNDVPEEVSSRISELDSLINSLDAQLERQDAEKQSINSEFAAKIERFQELKTD